MIDYTAPTRLINFRIYASSGNPVIYNNNVPVLRGRNNFCASVAYLVFQQWYKSQCYFVMDSGYVHMEICAVVDVFLIMVRDLAMLVL